MKAYLIDLDGTMYHGSKIVDGAKEWIDSLLANDIPFIFLTNNSSRTPIENSKHMLDMGFKNIEPKHFYTSALAASSYISRNYTERRVFYIGADSMKEALVDKGFEIVNGTDGQADFVFVGLDKNATYLSYSKAVKHLVSGAILVGTNNDRILMTENGPSVGNGSIVALFEYLTDKESIKIGKPHKPILIEALEYLNLTTEDVIMVGDNLETDIKFAGNFGIESVFVTSGVHIEEDIERLEIMPTRTIKNLRELM